MLNAILAFLRMATMTVTIPVWVWIALVIFVALYRVRITRRR